MNTLMRGARPLSCGHSIAKEATNALLAKALLCRKANNMLVKVDGDLSRGCSTKDIVIFFIRNIGTAGSTGYTIKFRGSAISFQHNR